MRILESPYGYWCLRTIVARTVGDADGRTPLDTIPLPDSPDLLRAPVLDLLQKQEASEAEDADVPIISPSKKPHRPERPAYRGGLRNLVHAWKAPLQTAAPAI